MASARCALLLFLMAAGLHTAAQQPYSIRHFTTADGLATNTCMGIYEDGTGFCWVYTATGASRFDGRHFTNFAGIYNLPGRTPPAGEAASKQWWTLNQLGIELYYPDVPEYAALPVADWIHDTAAYIYSLTPPDIISVSRGNQPVNRYRVTEQLPPNASFDHSMPDNPTLQVRRGGKITLCHIGPQGYTKEEYLLPAGATTSPRLHLGHYSHNVYLYTRNMVWRHTGAGHWDTVYCALPEAGQIRMLTETRDGKLWLATSNGLVRLTRKLAVAGSFIQPTHYFRTNTAGRRLFCTDSGVARNKQAMARLRQLSAYVMNIYLARDSAVWLCTTNGAYRIDKAGTVTARNRQAGTYQAAAEDAAGRVWISSFAGVLCYDRGAFRDYGQAAGIPEPILGLAIDGQQIVYTAGTAVFALLPGQQAFTNLSARLGIPEKAAMKLTTGPDGKVWLCQRTGPLLQLGYAPARGFFIADSLELSVNGMELIPLSICFDAHGNLWVSGRYMAIYTPDKAGRYDAHRQIILPELPNDSGFPDLAADGGDTVSLCYMPREGNKMYRYPPDLLHHPHSDSLPLLYLTGLLLGSKVRDWAAMGYETDMLGVPQQPVFSSQQNFLSFQYTAIAAHNPDAVSYRYRLKGLGGDWVVTATGQADFTSLSPGAYTFELQADDGTGRWQGQLAYSFTILPPWYRTWWAITLDVLLAAGIVYTLLQRRIRAVEAKAKMELVVMEEQLRALRAQINPHFLQNSFAVLGHQLDNEAAMDTIHQLSAYLRNVLYLSDEPVLTMEDELGFIKTYLDIQQMLIQTPFRYIIDVEDDADTFGTRVPSMLLQPLVENALKYGLKSNGDNLITIRVWEDADYLYCAVSDTGSGLPQAAKPEGYKSKGIDMTLTRMKLLYQKHELPADIKISQNGAGGYVVVVSIPGR